MADSTRRKRVPRRKGQAIRVLRNNGKRFQTAWKESKKNG